MGQVGRRAAKVRRQHPMSRQRANDRSALNQQNFYVAYFYIKLDAGEFFKPSNT